MIAAQLTSLAPLCIGTLLLALWRILLLQIHKRTVTNGPKHRSGVSGRIPPGPIGFPIIGSFPYLMRFPERALHRWAEKYGSFYTFKLGSQLVLVISDPGIAKDIMVTNGAVFSDRKESFIKSHTIFKSRGITASPYNDRWRKHRRLAALWLNPRAVDSYSYILDREAALMIQRMYDVGHSGKTAIDLHPHAAQFSLNNMLNITFGIRTDDPLFPAFNKSVKIAREFMNLTGPISNIVDHVPWLQNLPSGLFRRGERLHEELVSTYGEMLKDMERRLANDQPVPDCFAKMLLEMKSAEGLDDLDVIMLVSAFLIAGVDAAASVMQWFSVLIPSYPDVQKRAQAELDAVVGRNRLPNSVDLSTLPYCRSIIKEVERYRSPFWIPTPHYSTSDFVYREWFIPKNTLVLLNSYTMQHDATRHADPYTFNPERYMKDKYSSAESANLSNPYERDHWIFGYGRRICPAMALTERQIFLSISRLLWAFDMNAVDGEVLDTNEYDGENARSPAPFRLKLTPRHDSVASVLSLELGGS